MKKFKNIPKRYFILSLICFLVMTICILYETNIFFIVKNFIFNSEYRENFTLAESNIKTNINIFQVIHQVISNYDWKFDYSIIFGTNFFQLILPCIVSISGLVFYNKYHNIYNFSIHRNQNYKKYIKKEIRNESIKTSLSVFSAFLFFYILIIVITKGELSTYGMGRSLFLDVFGTSFYYANPYFYYLLDGLVRFFLIPFIYTYFSCSVSIIAKSKKQVFFISNIYYYGLSVIGFGLYYIFGEIAIYINPSVIMASGSYSNVNTILLLFVSLIPLLIGNIILRGKTHAKEIY